MTRSRGAGALARRAWDREAERFFRAEDLLVLRFKFQSLVSVRFEGW